MTWTMDTHSTVVDGELENCLPFPTRRLRMRPTVSISAQPPSSVASCSWTFLLIANLLQKGCFYPGLFDRWLVI